MAPRFVQARVGHAQTENETPLRQLCQSGCARHGGKRIPAVDVGDAAGDRQPLGAAQNDPGCGVGIAREELGQPQGFVAQVFHALCIGQEVVGIEPVGIEKHTKHEAFLPYLSGGNHRSAGR